MSGRGLHLALSDDELVDLRSLPAAEQASYIGEVLEAEKFGSDNACETDKAWAYMHAALTGTDPDGPLQVPAPRYVPSQPGFLGLRFGKAILSPSTAKADERNAVMGCEAVLLSEDYYIGLLAASDLPDVADALKSISNEELGERVRSVHVRFKASGNADDAAEYVMGWYPDLVEFFSRAADAGKHVIFTVDF